MSSSPGDIVSPATACAVSFLFLVGPVLLGYKSENCVRFNPVFNPFRNIHGIYHSPFSSLVSLTGFPGSLRYHHHSDGFSHHYDDDVEGILYQELRK